MVGQLKVPYVNRIKTDSSPENSIFIEPKPILFQLATQNKRKNNPTTTVWYSTSNTDHQVTKAGKNIFTVEDENCNGMIPGHH